LPAELFPRDRDLKKGHPLLVQRWTALQPALEQKLGCPVIVWECYRSDQRQGWLYGQGRNHKHMIAKGLDPSWARPGLVVTNAWSAKTSAHGHLSPHGEHVFPAVRAAWPDGVPASCALDVVPLGADGRPWTTDDPWTAFSALSDEPLDALVKQYGLIHFRAPGKQVWDKPHLQLMEWDDALHALRV